MPFESYELEKNRESINFVKLLIFLAKIAKNHISTTRWNYKTNSMPFESYQLEKNRELINFVKFLIFLAKIAKI